MNIRTADKTSKESMGAVKLKAKECGYEGSHEFLAGFFAATVKYKLISQRITERSFGQT